jgi:hypothetical protein
MIRVVLPHHLQTLARCDREVTVEVDGTVTQRSVLDALEARYPMLRGTVREHVTMKRRPRVRFFADGEDVTHESPDAELPDSIRTGDQPFRVVGAIAGG